MHTCPSCINPLTLEELAQLLQSHNLEIGEYTLKFDGVQYVVVLNNGEENKYEHLDTALLLLVTMVGEYTKKGQ
jgi:hypothetical protein